MTRICFVAALALGVAVAWTASVPMTASGADLVGGWEPYNGCCDGDHLESCGTGQPCAGGITGVCNEVLDDDDECGRSGRVNECTGPFNPCLSTYDSSCQ